MSPPSSPPPPPPPPPASGSSQPASSRGGGTPRTDDAPPFRYGAALAGQIEERWQGEWDKRGTFRTPNPGEAGFDASRPKKFILDMFPYPSGVGLHVGHPLGYIATDIYARYLRMTGHNVLHAMGFDSFGLPAEQYAVQTNTHPRVTTERNIATMRAQLRRLGLGHDAHRSVSTTDPEFYKWTQWIFLQIYNSWYDTGEGTDAQRHDGTKGRARPIGELIALFEAGRRPTSQGKAWGKMSADERREEVDAHRLAYLAEVPVNWCPMLGTVLANEEVIDGKSERGNYPVYKRPLKQWMMRITAYAERLLADLDTVAWPEALKTMQRNWIGRSEGAYVDFECSTRRIRVFTTRPDTLFGATYMVLSPEHEMVDQLLPEKYGAAGGFKRAIFPGGDALVERSATPREVVEAYRAYAKGKSDDDRTTGNDKTGCFTGAYAINPVNGARLPVFIADYVLAGYGTGAIMAVPGQDQRDWDFAKAFSLPIVRTVQPPEGFAGEAYTEDGPAINSGMLNGKHIAEAKKAIGTHLESIGRGKATVNYKLRDWLFSRQRYWGEPFPIVFDERGIAHDLPESMLPVLLPEVANFQPESSSDPDAPPRPPLARAKDWVNATLDLGDGRGPRAFTRETNTMPNWAGSCWYYLRYLDPENGNQFVSPEAERYWMVSTKSRGTALQAVSSMPPDSARSPVGRDLQKSARNLPHWQKGGENYFVTFKLGSGALSDDEKRIVLDACRHWDGDRLTLWAACVMPDHVHMIVRPLERAPGEWHALGDLMGGIKRHSAREINRARGTEGSLWQDESFDRIIRPDEFDDTWAYLIDNPVKAGLAAKGGEWPFTLWRSRSTEPLVQGGIGGHSLQGCATSLGSCTTEHDHALFDPSIHHSGGVDLYVGGVEHAVLHLLYARFWHKVLFDLGRVSTPEPFGRLFNQGYIQAHAFQDERGAYVEASHVKLADGSLAIENQDKPGPFFFDGKPVTRSYGKMGKSLKNAATPDDVCGEYGCDTLRVYEMSMGPLEASKPWNTRDIAGAHRFLQRVWRNLVHEQTGALRVSDAPGEAALVKLLHKTIAGVRKDMEGLGFNTAVAKLIEFNNELTKQCGPDAAGTSGVPRAIAEPLALMLAPLAPHMAEELWKLLGHTESLAHAPFPVADEALAADDQIEIPVQVLGKLRGKVVVPAGSDAAAIEAAAKADPKIAEQLSGKTIKKVIVVPGKLVNFVVA